MTDEPRLREARDAVEGRLARLFDEDIAPVDAKDRTLRALAAAGYLPSGAAPATPHAEGASAAHGLAKVAAPVWLKSLGLGVVAGALTMGGVEAYRASRDAHSATRVSVPAVVVPATRQPEYSPNVATRSPPIAPTKTTQSATEQVAPVNKRRLGARTTEEVVSESAAPRTSASQGTAPQAPVTAPSSLTLEVAFLDRARAVGAQGRWSEAYELLGAYSREFPSGALSPEAALLEVEALLALGRRSEAEEAANRFAARHPSSPHLRRLRSLLLGTR